MLPVPFFTAIEREGGLVFPSPQAVLVPTEYRNTEQTGAGMKRLQGGASCGHHNRLEVGLIEVALKWSAGVWVVHDTILRGDRARVINGALY